MSSAARYSSCTSPAGIKRSARAALVSLALLAIVAMPTLAAEQIDMDAEVRDLKADVLDLNRELFLLEEELLFPANTQVAVYLSMDTGNFFQLDSVQVTIRDSGLRDRDVVVLSVTREGIVIPAPRSDREILSGDVLLCYGKSITLRSLAPPRPVRNASRKRKNGKKAATLRSPDSGGEG